MKRLLRPMLEHRRTKIRKLARAAIIHARGNFTQAESYVRKHAGTLGNPLTMLMILGAVLQICYTLWKFWRDSQLTTPPLESVDGEPFYPEE